jgi:cytochrome c nitrite reductase small subunit
MSWTSRTTIALAVMVGAVALAGIAIPLTDHPEFCAGCHTIAPSYKSWTKSSHKDVSCVACHVRPGLHGWLIDKVWAGAKDVAITLVGHRHILRVSEIASRDLPLPVKEVGLVVSHRRHMEAFTVRGQGEGCTTCHAGVVHDEPIKGYPIVIPRGHVSADSKPWTPSHPEGSALRTRALSDCFRCHDGKTQHGDMVLDRKCDTCHISDKVSGALLFN